ncbi:MAG TPA: RNA 2',3'-cyclic phosphodiesterase [Rhizomicrobium sp.]|nr:RNA 2',3'-cyclic phosphodiesterase [Rhizomicrobium sp.]
MIRLFAAIAIPDSVAQSLFIIQGGVPGARWQVREQLHLTLRFIGDVDGRDAAAVDDALSGLSAPGFAMRLKGVGEFGAKHPAALWAGVEKNEVLLHLQRKIETALQRAGFAPEGRKYLPHVTLARLRGTPRGAVMDYLTDHALYTSEPFAVERFSLYSSVLTASGSKYAVEQDYELRG